jgi:O-antigen ligase
VLVIASGVATGYVLTFFSFEYAVALLVGLAVVLVILIEPFAGLLAIVFTVPMEDYFEMPGLPISLMKLIGLVAMGAVLLCFVAFRHRRTFIQTPQNWLLPAFLGAVLLSGLLGIDGQAAMKDFARLGRVLAIYPMAIYLVDSSQALRRVLWTMAFAGFLSSAVGIQNFYVWRATHVHDMRISGTMNDVNDFAATMILVAIIIFYLWRTEKNSFLRWMLVAMGATIGYAVTLTASRGAMLALGASLLILLLQQKHRVRTLLVLATLAIIATQVMPASSRQRLGLTTDHRRSTYDATTSTRDASTQRRISYQVLGMRLFLQNPLTGIGLGNFGSAYDRSEFRWSSEQTETGQRSRVAHNMYLEILVGTGLIGMLPFVGLLYLTIRDYARTYRRLAPETPLRLMSQGLLAGFCALLVASLFLSAQYGKYLWLLLALAPVTLRLAQSSDERTPHASPWTIPSN